MKETINKMKETINTHLHAQHQVVLKEQGEHIAYLQKMVLEMLQDQKLLMQAYDGLRQEVLEMKRSMGGVKI